jgi:hypothetical protein
MKVTRIAILFALLTSLLVPAFGYAGASARKLSPEKAAQAARQAFARNRSSLTGLKMDCLVFEEPVKDSSGYSIVVRERHDVHCGGDPKTSPTVAFLKVEGKSGIVSVEDTVTGEDKVLK